MCVQCLGLCKYLNNYLMDCHVILYTHVPLRMNRSYFGDDSSFSSTVKFEIDIFPTKYLQIYSSCTKVSLS